MVIEGNDDGNTAVSASRSTQVANLHSGLVRRDMWALLRGATAEFAVQN